MAVCLILEYGEEIPLISIDDRITKSNEYIHCLIGYLRISEHRTPLEYLA
jgi:hypothetical protein